LKLLWVERERFVIEIPLEFGCRPRHAEETADAFLQAHIHPLRIDAWDVVQIQKIMQKHQAIEQIEQFL
jgi:hypothetical protein